MHAVGPGSYVEITRVVDAVDADGNDVTLRGVRGFVDVAPASDGSCVVNVERVLASGAPEVTPRPVTVNVSDVRVVSDSETSDDARKICNESLDVALELFRPLSPTSMNPENLAEVMKAITEAVAAQPTSVGANYYAGEVFHWVGETLGEKSMLALEARQKQRAYRAAMGIKELPNDVRLALRINLANAYGFAGDQQSELDTLQEVLKDHPGHLLARFMLGNIYRQRQRFSEALVQYMMARDLPNDAPMQLKVSKGAVLSSLPIPEDYLQMIRQKSKDQMKRLLIDQSRYLVGQNQHEAALETLSKFFTADMNMAALQEQLELEDLTRCVTIYLICLARTNHALEAKEMAKRYVESVDSAVFKDQVSVPVQSWFFTTFAQCFEALADQLRGGVFDIECGEDSKSYYQRAKEVYAAADIIMTDQLSREGYVRVQVKSNPGFRWIPGPDCGMHALNCGGNAEILDSEAEYDQLL